MSASCVGGLSKLQSLNGLFAIYKKPGATSADVLNTLKETLLKEAGMKNPNPRKRKKQDLKMGHGGTLDSSASGVLVVGIGSGTKMLSKMLSGSKKYSVTAELGKATDTLDGTGQVTLVKDYDLVTSGDLEEKLKLFTGDIMQVPPLYCALKKDGKRMSVLLKQGHSVEAKAARPVTVYNLTLKDFSPPLFTLDVECGGGFYVRSLVDDLGKAVSSCAHVKELIRTKQGQFTLEEHALHQHHWTLERILQCLQPCSDEQNTPPDPLKTDSHTPPNPLKTDSHTPPNPLKTDSHTPPNPLKTDSHTPPNPLKTDSHTPPNPLKTDSHTPPPPLKTDSNTPPNPLKTDSNTPPNPLKTDSHTPPNPLKTDSHTPPNPLKTDSHTPPNPLKTDSHTPPNPLKTDSHTPPNPLKTDSHTPPPPLKTDSNTPPNPLKTDSNTPPNPLKTDSHTPPPPLKTDSNTPPPPLKTDSNTHSS